MYYLWVVLWAAYYLPRRVLWIHVAGAVAAYAVTLHAIGAGSAVYRWISLSGLLAARRSSSACSPGGPTG
jgi:hypothetical protein